MAKEGIETHTFIEHIQRDEETSFWSARYNDGCCNGYVVSVA